MNLTQAIDQNLNFLIVGCDASKERDAMSEFWHVLVKYCKITPNEVFSLQIRGLFLICFKETIENTITKLRQVLDNSEFPFRICKKITPLDRLLKSNIEQMLEIIPNYLGKIPETASWRIVVNRRHAHLKRADIITAIASHPSAPKGKVDLVNADWSIHVEIIGGWMGVSVIPTSSILLIP